MAPAPPQLRTQTRTNVSVEDVEDIKESTGDQKGARSFFVARSSIHFQTTTTQATAAATGTKTHDPYYGQEKMATLAARFINFLFQCPVSPPGNPSPQVRLPFFIAYAMHRTRLHTCVIYAALVLLQRLKARFPTAKGSSGHRLFISAYMIASKVICDDTYSNRSWSIVAQGIFSLREMNQMERELCSYLDWELTVADPILSDFITMVERDFGPHAPQPYPTYSLQQVSRRAAKTSPSASSTPIPEPVTTSSSPIPNFTQSRNPTPTATPVPPSSPPRKKRGSFAPKPVSLPDTSSDGTPLHSFSNTTTPQTSPVPPTPIDTDDIQVAVGQGGSSYSMDRTIVQRYKQSGLKTQLYSKPVPALW